MAFLSIIVYMHYVVLSKIAALGTFQRVKIVVIFNIRNSLFQTLHPVDPLAHNDNEFLVFYSLFNQRIREVIRGSVLRKSEPLTGMIGEKLDEENVGITAQKVLEALGTLA